MTRAERLTKDPIDLNALLSRSDKLRQEVMGDYAKQKTDAQREIVEINKRRRAAQLKIDREAKQVLESSDVREYSNYLVSISLKKN